jgi:hypothetical protein
LSGRNQGSQGEDCFENLKAPILPNTIPLPVLVEKLPRINREIDFRKLKSDILHYSFFLLFSLLGKIYIPIPPA